MQSQVASKKFDAAKIKAMIRDNIIIVGIILISLAVGIMHPKFFPIGNFRNLISNTAVIRPGLALAGFFGNFLHIFLFSVMRVKCDLQFLSL
jgi:hypothetical protein